MWESQCFTTDPLNSGSLPTFEFKENIVPRHVSCIACLVSWACRLLGFGVIHAMCLSLLGLGLSTLGGAPCYGVFSYTLYVFWSYCAFGVHPRGISYMDWWCSPLFVLGGAHLVFAPRCVLVVLSPHVASLGMMWRIACDIDIMGKDIIHDGSRWICWSCLVVPGFDVLCPIFFGEVE